VIGKYRHKGKTAFEGKIALTLEAERNPTPPIVPFKRKIKLKTRRGRCVG